MKIVDCALIGIGSVGKNLLRILIQKKIVLKERYGIEFRIILVADSTGVATQKEANILHSVDYMR
jgi:homoserine dehydrogenase